MSADELVAAAFSSIRDGEDPTLREDIEASLASAVKAFSRFFDEACARLKLTEGRKQLYEEVVNDAFFPTS